MSKINKYIIISLIVSLFGEIYFYPFESGLKFSAGVIIFNLCVLMMEDMSEVTMGILCGLGVFMTRNIFGVLLLHHDIIDTLVLNFPSLLYYLIYGVLLKITKVRKYKNSIVNTIFILALTDSFCNIGEVVMRNGINVYIVRIIIFVGFIRGAITYLAYLTYNRQKLFILNSEHQKRYTELNLLISNIQAEMFYLKKSMKDIEKVMSKSYSLYETYKNNEYLREKTLDIAREVHEIKKDYYRVLKGFEALIDNFENEDEMTLSNIFTIIKDNTSRYIKESNKEIEISFHFEKDFTVKDHCNLFVILNNLIINSIDDCENSDFIKISEKEDEDNIYFEVTDTGKGIDEDIFPYIFNAGFTTKYDDITGEASTGIGLSHVKNIIDNLGGYIEVKSETNLGTTFILKIPKNSLNGG
ncbi:sensor histidine kinase [Clostridium tagluense]|uniref:sensor histidine kinase n=1 Tax=Clostridium tagluense TaxID=360422 RepID=UPI001C6E5229|nr:ATP-binding protein [Clostridium tagluense]MBW9156761.1 GHKL domain-containing protein [Clostridium tagluense]WLC66247.1 GHKL domain-containing protein [Clostridium tagluense]